MKKTHDLVATVGKYQNKQGEQKKRFMNCGSIFTDSDGRISIKIDGVPVGPEFTGWLSPYPVKEGDRGAGRGTERDSQQSRHTGHQDDPSPPDSADDGIPF